MKTAALILLAATILPAVAPAQTIPGAPAYQLPVTVTAQKWYGSGPPTLALGYPVQPGDSYFDTTNNTAYFCAAPVTATIPLAGGPSACTSVGNGGWLAATGFVHLPLTLSQLQTLNTVGVQILPAFGAGTWTEILSCSLDLKRGSAAFTGGDAVTIGWGASAATTAAAATIAATVFTTFASSHTITVAGALAVTANTLIQNLPVWMNAGSGGDFASGTGATGAIDCNYHIHYGN